MTERLARRPMGDDRFGEALDMALADISRYEDSVLRPYGKLTVLPDADGRLRPREGVTDAVALAYGRLCAEYLAFGDAVDAVLAGTATRWLDIRMRETTPRILRELGMPDTPIGHTASHIRSETHPIGKANLHWHGIPVHVLKRIPELIERPAAVFEHEGRIGVMVAETNYDPIGGREMPLVVYMRPHLEGSRVEGRKPCNFALTVMGEWRIERNITSAIERGELLYVNRGLVGQGKMRKALMRAGHLLPGALSAYDGIIRQASWAVKDDGRLGEAISEARLDAPATEPSEGRRRHDGPAI